MTEACWCCDKVKCIRLVEAREPEPRDYDVDFEIQQAENRYEKSLYGRSR